MRVVVVDHPAYPGKFHFPGQISIVDFLTYKTNYSDEIVFHVFGEATHLPVKECSIASYEQVVEEFIPCYSSAWK